MSDKLQQAIAFIQAGDKQSGKRILAEILKTEPQNEKAWLWMSGVVTKDEERRYCLKRVLAINPDSLLAKKGLARLQQEHKERPRPPTVPKQPMAPPLEVQPEAVAGGTKVAFSKLKLVVVLSAAFLICGATSIVVYLILTAVLRAPRQIAQPAAADDSASIQVRAGEPTATPPGEDIADPNYLQGKAAYEAKDYEQVLRLMTLVLEADPNLAPPYWYRGMAYFYLKDYQAGLEEMERALVIDPDYALGYADRGLMYVALGNERRAMADWQRALSLDPTLAKTHHNIGVMYYNRGDYARAVEEYTMALTIDPGRAQTWNDKSEALLGLGQYQDCVESASRAIELQPDLWTGYYNLGTCKANLGQYASAIPDLDVYLNVVKDNPHGWYNRGLSHRFLGHNQQAVEDYARAIELDPTFAWALINRGNAYVDLGEYELALTDYNAALALGDIARAYMGRGDVYLAQERYDEAVTEYQTAIGLLPGYADAYARLARAYLDQSEHQKAIETADKALKLDDGGNRPIILQTRSRAYYGLGDFEQAIADLDEVIRIHPTVMDFYYRGIAYQANGQKQEAIQDLEFFVAQGGAQSQVRISDAEARLSELRQ